MRNKKYIFKYILFLFKNYNLLICKIINLSAKSLFSRLLLSIRIELAVLKTLSKATDDPCTHRYFLANSQIWIFIKVNFPSFLR